MGLGIIIGYFGIKGVPSDSWKYDNLTREADPTNYRTYIDSVQAANIEANLKYTYHYLHFYRTQSIESLLSRDLTSRPHLAGLPEDLESAEVIERRWIDDGLDVFKPQYNVLFSYPDENNPNRLEHIFHSSIFISFFSHLLVSLFE